LDFRLHHAAEQRYQTVSQGFIGHGIAGEALLMFRESSFEALARLLGVEYTEEQNTQTELLMEVANTLIGAFLSSFEQQLDISFSRASPVVLDLFDNDEIKPAIEQRTMAINIHYSIQDYDIQCDLMLVFTEDSTQKLQHMASYF